ncbi:MAG TPA: hypothetical protein PLA50_02340 [Bacteroidia bacterium]|nr:hypothetical protein [Bacteroidia bacterium]
MKSIATVAGVSALIGAVGGVIITCFVLREPNLVAPDSPFMESNEFDGELDPLTGRKDWLDRLAVLSGDWVSADGDQTAQLDYRVLRFKSTVDWPDLDGRSFLLGEEMQFMTESGFYSLHASGDSFDMIFLIKEGASPDGDLSRLTLYREGSPLARSRQPLGEKMPPPKVQALLDAIPSIREGVRKDDVMERLGLARDGSLELLDAERSSGQTDMLLTLGIDDEWMLRLRYDVESSDVADSEAKLRKFQVVRGYVNDIKAGRFDIEKRIYPYFLNGRIIGAPDSAPSSTE